MAEKATHDKNENVSCNVINGTVTEDRQAPNLGKEEPKETFKGPHTTHIMISLGTI